MMTRLANKVRRGCLQTKPRKAVRRGSACSPSRTRQRGTHVRLADLAKEYRQYFAQGLEEELDFYRSLSTLEEVVVRATGAEDASGKIHSHQRRVGRETLGKARRRLRGAVEAIADCESFDELHELVGRETQTIPRFGSLAVYDTTVRIGAWLGLEPEMVYLHAGAKRGASNLGLDVARGVVDIKQCPAAIRFLGAQHLEDFFCIYKSSFD